MATTIKIGIIGCTGLDNQDLLNNRAERKVSTPFGDPSGGIVVEGAIEGVPCVILSRHGPAHDIKPPNVNYRANIWALKDAGCTHIIATTAVGSLKDEIVPGDFIILNDFFDKTYQQSKQTFHDGSAEGMPGIFHLPVHPPFSEPLREVINQAAEEVKLLHHNEGTVLTVDGPRFLSNAENNIYKLMGCSVVNMSTVPEVVLAKEAGILYAAIALVTDHDCWKQHSQSESHNYVSESYQKNVGKLKELIVAVVKKINAKNWDKELEDLKILVGILPPKKGAAGGGKPCSCEKKRKEKKAE